jgi:hypothetical protein
MESQSLIHNNVNNQDIVVNTSSINTPKTLPIKYKSMLYASIYMIHNYLPVEQRETIYEKLPIYKSVEEQIQYFETHCDMKKIEVELYKPMLKEHQKKIKELNKPVKEKKPRVTSTKKKNVVVVAATINSTIIDNTCDNNTKSTSVDECKNISTSIAPTPSIIENQDQAEKIFDNSPTVIDTTNNTLTDSKLKETKRKTVVKNTNKQIEENKKQKVPRKKKEEKAAVTESTKSVTSHIIESSEDEPDMFLFIQNGQRYWTTDEHFQNGYLYGSHKDEDGDIVPNTQLVGRLVNGVANLF